MNNIGFFFDRRLRFGLILTIMVLLPGIDAIAAELPDPTRPPPSQRQLVSFTPAASSPQPAAAVLQSVMTGEGRKPSAIISGRLVQLGESYNGMRLTQVTEQGAVLTGPKGGATLPLTPGLDKQAAAAAAPQPRLSAVPTAAAKVAVQTLSLQLADQK